MTATKNVYIFINTSSHWQISGLYTLHFMLLVLYTDIKQLLQMNKNEGKDDIRSNYLFSEIWPHKVHLRPLEPTSKPPSLCREPGNKWMLAAGPTGGQQQQAMKMARLIIRLSGWGCKGHNTEGHECGNHVEGSFQRWLQSLFHARSWNICWGRRQG